MIYFETSFALTLVIVVITTLFFVFLSLIVGSNPGLKTTRLGRWNRAVTKEFPALLMNYMGSFKTISDDGVEKKVNYASIIISIYKTIFQGFYIWLLYVFFIKIFPYYTEGYFACIGGGTRPQILALIGVPLNLFFYLKTLTTDPGYITKENYQKALEMFEFDNVLYFPRYCKVCDIQCPARSYHCKMCNACVLGYDHHCILTHKCVGIRNERYLYSFCISFILICTLGYTFNFVTMMSFAAKAGYPPNYYYNFETKHLDVSKGFYVFMGIFHDHPSEWILNFILLFGVPVGAIFTLFQTYLHFNGITTYEHYRRVKLRNDIKDKKVFFIIPPKDSGKKKYVVTIDPDNPDDEVKIEEGSEKVLVNYVDQIPYAYSQGFIQNMINMLFPKF